MALPAQFELGLELTNIINPIGQALSALGSLALADAINKSGSDALTELKLASLIGKHRIDPVIKFHFREVVQKSEQSAISRYLDITLASGAGPTVQEALKNPALFSMVVQLSALAFAHQDESLAFAIVEAIEKIVQAANSESISVPDYPSLLGTIRACQQQTAAFQWASLFEAVERRLAADLEHGRRSRRNARSWWDNEKFTSEDLPDTELASFTDRAIPFPVLQSLIMWLQTLQNFPKHRLLHLKCDSGISTIVVWCHHVLGLGLTVSFSTSDTYYGESGNINLYYGEPSNIIVTASDPDHLAASLMDAETGQEPLFTLNSESTQFAVGMGSEYRVNARGFGSEALRQADIAKDERSICSHWVIARCLLIRNCGLYDEWGPIPDRRLGSNHVIRSFESKWLSDERLIDAGKFLFDLSSVDQALLEESMGHARDIPRMMQGNWRKLVDILFAFASISKFELDTCSNMPLSLTVYKRHINHDQDVIGSNQPDQSPPLINAFNLLSKLLLGQHYSDEFVRPAVLISAMGWSVFFDIVDAVDPTDVSVHTLRVMRGVPSRRESRRVRIIDGPSERSTTPQVKVVNLKFPGYPEFPIFPGISNASKGATLVAQSTDAFHVTQNLHWYSTSGHKQTYRLGVRRMQNLSMRVRRLPPCQCTDAALSFDTWLANHLCHSVIDQRGAGSECKADECCWPCDRGTRESRREKIFLGRALVKRSSMGAQVDNPCPCEPLFFYVTQNSASRWLQPEQMINSSTSRIETYIRGNETCYDCACERDVTAINKTVQILL